MDSLKKIATNLSVHEITHRQFPAAGGSSFLSMPGAFRLSEGAGNDKFEADDLATDDYGIFGGILWAGTRSQGEQTHTVSSEDVLY